MFVSECVVEIEGSEESMCAVLKINAPERCEVSDACSVSMVRVAEMRSVGHVFVELSRAKRYERGARVAEGLVSERTKSR